MEQVDAEVVRLATPGDVDQIYEVHLSNGEADEWESVAECREQIEWMVQFDAASVVAEMGGRIVGEMKVWWGEDVTELGSTLDLSTLYVRRDWHHKGIGSELIRWAVKSAQHHGCERVTVWPNEDSAPFYRKCGFEDGLVLQRFLVTPSVGGDGEGAEMAEVSLQEIEPPTGGSLMTQRILHPSQRWQDLLKQQADTPISVAGEKRPSVLSFSSKDGVLGVFRLHYWEDDPTKAELYVWGSGVPDEALRCCLFQAANLGLRALSILAYGEAARSVSVLGGESEGKPENVLVLPVDMA